MQQTFIERVKTVCKALDQRCYQDNTLFSDEKTPCYWKMSDLAHLYSFNMDNMVSTGRIYELKALVEKNIPEFKELYPQPIHILNIKDTYTIRDKATNQIKTVKNGPNQNLSRVACEYLFSLNPRNHIEQTYFLFQNKTVEEIADAAKDVRLANERARVSDSNKKLASVINRSYGATPVQSFQKIWSLIWQVIFNIKDMETLRQIYHIKNSPVDYMTPLGLNIANNMLTDIITKCGNEPYLNVDRVERIAERSALIARNRFAEYRTSPASQLLPDTTANRIGKINRARKKFWRTYYPESLVQR